jgi:hypothetical protein
MKPKRLTSRQDREDARRMRNGQWKFMERVFEMGSLWVCWWNKNRHHDYDSCPPDLYICGLIDGCELIGWLNSHKDWWTIGEWSDERYAAPVSLTPAGKEALFNRAPYDMEPVTFGLTEPGWIATPAKRKEVREES